MNLYDRYLKGEQEAVYKEIYELKDEALNSEYKKEVEQVLTETFERVAFNLQVIYRELLEIGYAFKIDCKHNFEKPIHAPLAHTELLLEQLDLAVQPFGFVPLSLKYFYRIVGGVNFAWNFEAKEQLMWDMADPIQLASLDSLVDEVTYDYWKEDIQLYVDDIDFGCAFLYLSADDLHKDNVSGGEAYALEITKEKSVDARFMNEANQTTFVDYLRICFEYCGFLGMSKSTVDKNYQKFFNKVKPQLKSI